MFQRTSGTGLDRDLLPDVLTVDLDICNKALMEVYNARK